MRQRGQGLIIFIVVVLVLALIGLFTVCTGGHHDNDNDGHSLGRVVLVSHRSDDGDCWDDGYDDCGRGRYDDDGQYYSGGGNGNRGRRGDNQRGDKNCHSFCGNTIVIPPGSGNGGGGDEPPPPNEKTSLVPPTPDKIIAGFQTMVDQGIALGTNITKLVTDFVVTVFRFIV